MRINLAIIAFLSCYIGVAELQAEPNNPQLKQGHGRAVIERLNLTPEQINELRCEKSGSGREHWERLEQERELLNSLLRDKDVNNEAITTQLEVVLERQAAIARHRLQRLLKARAVLNDEQLENLLAWHEQAGKRKFRRGQPTTE